MLLTLNTGLRRSEALTLTWDQVRLTGNPALTVKASHSKSSKARHIQLNNAALTVLKKWKQQGDGKGLVFSIDGQLIKRIDTAWKNLMRDAGIKGLNFHDLRHDFASQLVMNGVDLYTVRELMGHGSLEMSQR